MHLRTTWEHVHAHADVATALARTRSGSHGGLSDRRLWLRWWGGGARCRASIDAFVARNPALADAGPHSATEVGFLVHMTAAVRRTQRPTTTTITTLRPFASSLYPNDAHMRALDN
jgi:hypothetical protein